jgi:hypothetical protein
MTKPSVGKKSAPRKRGGDVMSTAAVSMIFNGVKYRAGQKPARVCPAPVGAPRPSAHERFLADVLSADADHIQQLRDQGAEMRKGGKPGRVSGKVARVRAHARDLHTKHQRLSPEQLYDKRDPEITGSMAKTTFAKHVRDEIGDAWRKK